MDRLSNGGFAPQFNHKPNIQDDSDQLNIPKDSLGLISDATMTPIPNALSTKFFIHCNLEGFIQFADVAMGFDGKSMPDLVGLTLESLFAADIVERLLPLIKEVGNSTSVKSVQVQRNKADKGEWLELSIVPISNEKVGILVRDISHQKKMQLTQKLLHEEMVSTNENSIFSGIALELAIALEVSEVRITTLCEEQLEALAWIHNRTPQQIEPYTLQDTPCLETVSHGYYCCLDDIQKKFPRDPSLHRLNSRSYVGVALQSSKGKTLGTICCLNQAPLINPQFAESLLQIVAHKVVKELERRQVIEDLEKLTVDLEQRVFQRTQALQRSEQDLRTIFNTAYDGIYIHEYDGTIVDVNDRALEMHGLNREQLLSLTIADFSVESPERAAQVQTLLAKSARGETLRFEWKGRNFKDPNRPLHNEVALRKAVLSDREVIIATLRDIRERKQREIAMKTIIEGTAMKSGLEYYMTCVKALDDIFHVPFAFLVQVEEQMPLQKIAVWADDDWESYPIEDLVQKTLKVDRELLIPNNLQAHTLIGNQFKDAESYLGTIIRDSKNKILGVLGIIRKEAFPSQTDTSSFIMQLFGKQVASEMERQVSAEMIRKSQEQLLSFIDYSPAFISIKDLDGHYLMSNKGLAAQFNLSPRMMIGKTDQDLFPSEVAHKIRKLDEAICQSAQEDSLEQEIVFSPDNLRTCLVTTFPLLDQGGQIYAIGSIATDISERKNAEEELYQSRQLLRAVLDTIPISVFWQDQDLQFLGCNQRFLNEFGFSNPSQVIGKKGDRIDWNIDEIEYFRSTSQKVLETQKPDHKSILSRVQSDGREKCVFYCLFLRA